MSEKIIFCFGEGRYGTKGIGYQKNHHAFNKQVTVERYEQIKKETTNILSDLKLELNKKNWTDEWKKVTPGQWDSLSKIPEFDMDVVEKIVGFRPVMNFNDEIKIIVEGKTVMISKKSAKALNLID